MRRRLTDRAWLLTGAAGTLAVGGMSIALAGGAVPITLLLAIGAVLLGACLLVPQALRATRRSPGWIVFGVLLVLLALWLGLWAVRATTATPGSIAASLLPAGWWALLPFLVILASAAAGMVLIADAVRVWLGLAPRQRAPWQQMTESRRGPDGIAWRAVAGVALVGVAAFLAYSLVARLFVAYSLYELIALLMIAGGVALVLGIPVAIGAFLRLGHDTAGTAHDRERQRFAAHLHDSVLQTLALVQRQAHDPAAVVRLARRQEHALRAWMAGESELASETLAAALREIVAEVEEEYRMTVELTAIGDRPLDSKGEALVAAAREALRNAGAARRRGARVYVFCEIGRTTAPRCSSATRARGSIPDDGGQRAARHPRRDVGRMAVSGGRATIDSVPRRGHRGGAALLRSAGGDR